MEEAILGQENVRQLKEKEVFYEDEADARRVESLLEKLKPVLPEAREIPYFLAYTSAVNAFCLIDGTLVVTKGILETINGETVQKVILMGAALPCDDGELLAACEKASQAPPWNLYSYRDHVLKYVYRSLFHKTALGFCGASAKQARMKEYLLDTLQPKEKIRDKVTSHAFRRYVAGIPDILSGRLLESTVKIDFHRIAPPRAWGLPIPQTGAKVAESYQGWNFTYYVGGMPKLKFPKLRRQKKPEDTAPHSTEEPGEPAGETEESAGEAGENEAPRPEEESGEEEVGDEALEKARRAHGFAIFNPLGELCFYSMDFHTAYARFTEIREALDKVSQGGPYPQE